MYKKLLCINLLLSTFIQATETNTSIDMTCIEKEISVELNTTIIENNISNETNITNESNITIIKKDKMVKSFKTKQITSGGKNFNMTKGDSKKGKEIFTRKLKNSCQTTSYKFATNYSQDEWEEIAGSGRFKEIIFKLCLNIKSFYQDDWSPDLYQFAYEHANDS